MNSPDRIKKVLLIDDLHLCRTFFAKGLRQSSAVSVAEAESAEDALKQIAQVCPDVIILNVSMRHCCGMALLQSICRKVPTTGLLAFSYAHQDHLYAERTICAGAAGYISAAEPGENLLEAVATVAAGGMYLSRLLRDKICIDLSRWGKKKESIFDILSHREFEVFCLTGYGHAPKQVADKLKVSPKTVETYRERIRQKLDLADGGELLLHASSYIRAQCLPQPI
jgi:DNA-binding NarL/FixJ family response regulator